MAFQISRLYDFQPGTKILSSQVDAELNQLVTAHNNFDAAIDLFKAILASSAGGSSVGITPIAGVDPTADNLQKFIASEVNARLAHSGSINNPHGVTNAQVGLGNVINVRQATETAFLDHTTNVSNPHGVTQAQVGLGNVDNTSDINKPVSGPQQTALNLKVDKIAGRSLILDSLIEKLEGIAAGAEVNVQANWTQTDNTKDDFIRNKPTLGTAAALNAGNAAGNVPVLDSNGKLAVTTIPATAITSVSVVSSQTAMLALVVEPGDVAIRTDIRKTFILRASPASVLSNWEEIITSTDLVLSVCGKVGNIVLTADDVGALDTTDIVDNLTSSETTKALSAAQGKALSTLLGSLSGLDIFFTSTSRDNLVNAINRLLSYIGKIPFNSFFGSISDLMSAINKLATDKVTSTTITQLKYESGKMYYTLDGITWLDTTGPQGIQGKGFNPRGLWVAGTPYINDLTTIDVVYYGGSSFFCKASTTSTIAPDNDATHWGLMALSGTAASGNQVLLTDYSIAPSYSNISPTDTANQAIAKLEAAVTLTSPSVDSLNVITDQMLQHGMVFDLPSVTDNPSPTNFEKKYDFNLGVVQLFSTRQAIDLSFLSNAYIDIQLGTDRGGYLGGFIDEDLDKLSIMTPKLSGVSLTTTAETDPRRFTITGTFTINFINPIALSENLVIKPRLVIPGISGTMTAYTQPEGGF